MAAGLIAGAIQGLGGAMQHNAQGQIEEKRKKALMALEQEMALEHEEVRHQNTLERDEGQHGYRMDELGQQHEYGLEELGARHGYSMEQERFRQSNQNARHYSSLSAREREGNNDWQMVKTEDGGLVQFSPSRNAYREANLPEGAVMGDMGGDLTDREKARAEMLGDQLQALRDKQAEGIEPLSPEEKTRLGRIEAELNGLLGGSTGPTPLERLLAGEEGADAPPQEGDAEPGSIPGIIQRERETQQNTQEANEARRAAYQAREQADAVLDKIEREQAGGASPDGIMAGVNRARGRGGVSEETVVEAQRVAEELLALDSNANLSVDNKRWLAERLMRLQDAGVPINLEQ
ncbi:hypothetical protein M8009_13125 [Halomonas sp. ATCH28]|uniref:Uncharacterized protein n=1 Tax=Halomonas gemina TaxID=2945105 RepID=A0ABT0T2Y0_9GAMM|nr:hypothetical protein [Halomonas gemina]MCL7941229.1 hypothetical protein [Halomonas gemina]